VLRTASLILSARPGAGRVLVATFVTLGLAYGFWYSSAVFLVAFLREFGWSRSVVAGAFSLLVMVHGLSGPLLGWLVERFGPRAVIAAGGGVLAGALLVGAHVSAVWELYARSVDRRTHLRRDGQLCAGPANRRRHGLARADPALVRGAAPAESGAVSATVVALMRTPQI